MALATSAGADSHGLRIFHEFRPETNKRNRIQAALGSLCNRTPGVGDETILRYYQYLAANLSFPFTAYYPVPRNSGEEVEYCCTVLELLDPRKYIWDEFDGIFCKTRKGRFETNLPLIELRLPEENRNSQLIDDYWFWFWNWR